MNQMLKFGIILGVICLTATFVLALTYQVTKPKIEQQFEEEEQKALKTIFYNADSFAKKTIDDIEYFEAFKNNNLTGYCFKVTASGYNGFIHIMAGIDLKGEIRGVSVLSHQETPGLGSKINEIKAGDKNPWFLRQFIGKPAGNLQLIKDIDAITGATISSRAVTSAINDTVNRFLKENKVAPKIQSQEQVLTRTIRRS